MAKRQSRTQRLQSELDNYKKWLQESEERNKKLIDKAEDSFLNSPTYNQMMERIGFLEICNNLNQSHIKHLESQKRKVDESIQQVFADNKAMMEHYKEDGEENSYFIGLTENWHEAKEYTKLKSEIADLKGKVEGLETLLKDRDTEINRLQGVVGELKHKITTAPSDHTEDLQKKIEILCKENQELREAKNKAESEVSRQRTLRMNVKSDLRQVERELETERMKKYDQYVPEDAASYQAMVHDLEFYKNLCEQQTDYRQTLERRIRELEEQVSNLATTTLPTDEAVAIIEQNIEQAKEIKVHKKSGRPPKIDSQKMALVVELKANGYSMRSIAEQLNISVGSVHRYIKMNEERK